MLPRVAVIGAGAMGGWSALQMRRVGASVTLLDQTGPAHDGASSGDASRVFRHTYADLAMTRLAKRARALWLDFQTQWKTPLYQESGVLWLVSTDADEVEKAGLANLKREGIDHESLTRHALVERFPQLNLDGVRHGFIEKPAGFLRARTACQKVVEVFAHERGDYRQTQAKLGTQTGAKLDFLKLGDGSEFCADIYLFACGSWLKAMFPDWLGSAIRPTRQEVFTFSAPDEAVASLPVWADHGEEFWYGIPDPQQKTFKIANDTRGAPFDPARADRTPSCEGLAQARAKMASRFPSLAQAPLESSRVCHYENTPDLGLFFDRHPELTNVWVMGGGSGHGFKHGPALGEMAAEVLLQGKQPPDGFLTKRWQNPAGKAPPLPAQ